MVDGDALPCLDLTPVLAQLDRVRRSREGGESAAGADRRQLARVADEHELAIARLHVSDEDRQITRAEHPGLADHEHRPGR